MAGRFPIYRTEKTLPGVGPNVTGRVNFDTGAGQMAAAIGRMGEAMFQVGGQMWQVQADQQYSEATAELRRKQNELQARIEANPDEDTYQEEMTRTLDEMENIPESLHLKNGLAARKFGLYLEVAKPEIEKYVATKTKQRIDDKWWGTYYDRMAEAERTGNISAFESLGRSGIGTVEEMNEKVLTKDLIVVRRNIENETVFSLAIRGPDKKAGYKIVETSNLSDKDKATMYNRLDSYWWGRKQQEDEVSVALINDVNRLAAEGKTFQEVETLIKQTVGISDKQKTDLLETYLTAQKLWQGGIKNPYETTQNPGLVALLDVKISAGEPISEMDIWRAQLSDPKNGPQFSRSDALSLIARLKIAENDILKSKPVQELSKRIYEMFSDDEQQLPKEKAGDYYTTVEAFRAIVLKHKGDLAAAQPEMDALLKPIKEGFVKTWLRRVGTFALPGKSKFGYFGLPWAGKKPKPQRPVEQMTDEELRAIAEGE